MRVAAASLCAALLVGSAAACAATPVAPSASSVEAEFGSFEAQLEALPGVEDAVLSVDDESNQVSLAVSLDGAATSDEIQEIGVQAGSLRQADMPKGVYPGQIELLLGDSIYSYFAVPTADTLRAQLDYWARLASSGVASVVTRTFTAPVQNPTPNSALPASTSGAPVLMNAPTGRFVSIMLPSNALNDVRATIDSLRAVPDPGASVGEWHVLSSDLAITAEFAGPRLPSEGDLDVAIGLVDVVQSLDDPSASLSIRMEPEGDSTYVSAQLTAFDEGLEGAASSTLENRMRSTALWPAMLRLVDLLDAPRGDFDFTLLSNSLSDASNLLLSASVEGCRFAGDPLWPSLSAELGAHWLAAHTAREPGATGCAVTVG